MFGHVVGYCTFQLLPDRLGPNARISPGILRGGAVTRAQHEPGPSSWIFENSHNSNHTTG